MKESVLQEEVGIIVIPKSARNVSNPEYLRFVQPIGEELAKQVYDEAEKLISRDYNIHRWFQGNVCYRKAEKDGIHGSSLDLNVIYNSILKEKGLSLLGLLEGKYLDKQRLLRNEFYREYGLHVASEGNPNADLGKNLIAEANKRNWKLPLVVTSYNPLGHRKTEKRFEIYFLDDFDLEKEVIHADQAREFLLTNFKKEWIVDKGIRRLFRDGNGGWGANVYDRHSRFRGRVDFVSGEASVENIRNVKEKELARNYDAKIAQLNDEIKQISSQKPSELEIFNQSLASCN